MRIIDVHCYANTKEWIACQQPYVDALASYWNRAWTAKDENEVVKDFADAGVEAILVALDLETTVGTPPLLERLRISDAKAPSGADHSGMGSG
jgi:hypothetical protein